MEIILLKDIEGLGVRDDVVTVKNGFGRNFLIPKRMAVVANKRNANMLKERVRQSDMKTEKMLGEIRQAVSSLEGSSLKVGAKVGTSGKIFGSVTNIQLADAIKKATGLDIDRRKITILEDIKELGTFKAELNLHKDIKPEIEFEVVAE